VESPRREYVAFLSHTYADDAVARRLHKALEKYRLPRGVADSEAKGRRNLLYPVFRDRDEAASGELGGRLREALRASRALVVMCSPHAATSEWIDAEVRYFQELGKGDKIFAYIVDGEPNASAQRGVECLPPALRADQHRSLSDDVPQGVLAADARPGRDGPHRAFLKLVAGILNLNLGRLIDREARRRRWRQLQATAAAIALSVATAFGGALFIQNQNQKARQLAQEAIDFVKAAGGCTLGDSDCILSLKLALAFYEYDRPWFSAYDRALALKATLPAIDFTRDKFLVWRSGLQLRDILQDQKDQTTVGFVVVDQEYRRFYLDRDLRLTHRISSVSPILEPLTKIGFSDLKSPSALIGRTLDMSASGDMLLTRELAAPSPPNERSHTDTFHLRVRDSRTGNLLIDFGQLDEIVEHARFSPTGQYVLAALKHNDEVDLVKIWNLRSRMLICNKQAPQNPFRPGARTNAFSATDFDKHSDRWFIAPKGRELELYELPSCALTGRYKAADLVKPRLPSSNWTDADYSANTNLTVTNFATTPDNSLVAASFLDYKIRVWNRVGAGQVGNFDGNIGAIQSVRFSSDGRLLIGAGSDGIAVWDVATKKLIVRIGPLNVWARDSQIVADGTSLVGLLDDGSARLWRVNDGRLLATYGGTSEAGAIILSGDGNRYAISNDAGEVVVGAVADGSEVFRVGLFDRVVTSGEMALDNEGSTLGVVGADRRVRIYEIPNGGMARNVDLQLSSLKDLPANLIAFVKTGIFVAPQGGGLRAFDLSSGKTFDLFNSPTKAIALTTEAATNRALIAVSDGSLRLYDETSEQALVVRAKFFSNDDLENIHAMSLFGNRALVAVGDTVKVVELDDSNRDLTSPVETGWIVRAVDSKGCRLFLASADRKYTFRVVDCRSGKDVVINTWYGELSGSGMMAAAFYPLKDSLIVSTGGITTSWQFERDIDWLHKLACAALPLDDRAISVSEMRRFPALAFAPKQLCRS
jgi:WD40 repeat protein